MGDALAPCRCGSNSVSVEIIRDGRVDVEPEYQVCCLACGRSGPKDMVELTAIEGWREPLAPNADASSERDGDYWQCGDQKLRAQAALRIVVRNNIRDIDVLTWLDGTIYEAGPAFAHSLAEPEDCPF